MFVHFCCWRCTSTISIAKLLCPSLVGSIEDESTAMANSTALVYHVKGRMIGIAYGKIDFDDAYNTEEGDHNHSMYEHDTHCNAKG